MSHEVFKKVGIPFRSCSVDHGASCIASVVVVKIETDFAQMLDKRPNYFDAAYLYCFGNYTSSGPLNEVRV